MVFVLLSDYKITYIQALFSDIAYIRNAKTAAMNPLPELAQTHYEYPCMDNQYFSHVHFINIAN